MSKTRKHNSIKFAGALRLFRVASFVFSAVLLAVIGFNTYTRSTDRAFAAPSDTLNFQARLLSASGSIVPDGNYSITFNIYEDLVGGSSLWTETWNSGTAQVSVKAGYLSVYLGTHTSFPDLDWSDDKFLTMNVNGDGEMSPRLKLTAVPFAFSAEQLGSRTEDEFVQLNPGATPQVVNTTNSAIAVNQAGSGNVLQLQSGGSDVLVINNSGDATFSGDVSAVNGDFSGTLTVDDLATFSGGATIASGQQFTNAGSSLFTAIAISNISGGGAIGTAEATVDVASTFNINQTTAGQTLTLPTPTDTTAGRVVYINNVGSEAFAMYGVTISSARSQAYIWNGSNWVGTNIDGAGSGVTGVGSLDGAAKNASGATVAANLIYLQTADDTYAGLVSTAAQTFAGAKTFNGQIIASAGIDLGTEILQGTSATINFDNFDVDADGDVTLAGDLAVNGGNITSTGALNITSGGALVVGATGQTTTVRGSVTTITSNGAGNSIILNSADTIELQDDTNITGDLSISGTLGVTGLATFDGGLSVATGQQFTNAGSTLFSAIAITNRAAGGNIGTAAATVDVATTFNVSQTTAGQTLTLPAPTDATAGRVAFVNNTGSVSFTMYDSVIAAGQSNTFIWNGSNWVTTVSLSGSVVGAIGTIDSQTKSADGAVITGGALFMQTADGTHPGLVSTGAQTFAGAKTFNGQIVAGAGIDLGAQTLQGTTAIIDFTNFDVDASGNTTVGGTLAVTGNTTLTGDIAVNGGDITSSATSFNLLNTTATTINAFGVATTINIGAATGTTNVNNHLDVAGTLNIGTSNAFQVSSTGAVTAVGINAGTGLLQGSGGLTVTGATAINTTGTTNTAIGNATGTLTLTSSGLNVTSAGAVSGVTTLSTSGIVTVGTLGVADNDTVVCRNTSGELAACNSTFATSNDIDGFVDTTGAPLANQIAYFNDANTLQGSNLLTFANDILTVGESSVSHLYNEGDENVTWVPGYQVAGASGLTKEANNLYLFASSDMLSVQDGEATWVTDTMVDLTGWDTLKIDWEAYNSYGNSSKALVISSSKANDHSVYDQRLVITGGDYSRTTDEIDISGLSGSYYIRVHLYTEDTNASIEMDVHNVWLERSSVTTADVVVTGSLTAVNAVFSGNLSAVNATFSGDLTVNGGDITSTGALNITPGGALTIGATSQTATVQGSVTTIASNGAGNDIVLNSADTIELQDNTNITGNLDVSGTLTAGTANAFQVNASGAVTAVGVNSGTGLIQGTGGLTVTGATSINTTGTANTAIGNATGTLTLTSSGLNVTSAGAVSGVTTLSTSGVITVGALGTADTDTVLCRNAAGQFASCSSTFATNNDLQGYVQLAPSTVQTDSSANPSIHINDTGGGNLLHLLSGGNDRLVLQADGDVAINGYSGSAGFGIHNKEVEIVVSGSSAFRVGEFAGQPTFGVDTSNGEAYLTSRGADNGTNTRNSPVFKIQGSYYDGSTKWNNFTLQTLITGTTANDYHLRLSNTLGTEVMRIMGNGNVGIGTSGTPSQLLSVGGATGNFTVTSAGAVTAVGVNAGAGLLQGTGGLTITGTTSINTTGTANTSIGNATGTLSITSAGLNVSSAGAVSGVTTLETTGIVTVGTLGTANTDAVLCRNSSNQLAACSSTFLTSANSFMQGGNDFNATAVLGTTDADDLEIITNNQVRLTVQANGDVAFDTDTLFVDATNNRVGIGTSTPGYGLEVATGDVKTSGIFVEHVTDFTPTAGNTGWYRIISTGSAFSSGIIRIVANYDNKPTELEFQYHVSGYGMPATITQTRQSAYNGSIVTQVRASNDGSNNAYLDIYVDSATAPDSIIVYGYGPQLVGFQHTPAYNPTVGSHGVKTLTLGQGVRSTDQVNVQGGIYSQADVGSDYVSKLINTGTGDGLSIETYNGAANVDVLKVVGDADGTPRTGLLVNGQGRVFVGGGAPNLSEDFNISRDGVNYLQFSSCDDCGGSFINHNGTGQLFLNSDAGIRLVSQGTQVLNVTDSVYGHSVGIGTFEPGSKLVVKGNGNTNATSALNILNSDDDSLFFVRNDGNVGIGTENATADLSFGGDSARTIKLENRSTNAAGNNLTVSAGNAGAGGSAFTGGNLVLQGGSAAGTGNANGGNVLLSGGAGVGTGVKGLVVIDTPTFATATQQNCATNCVVTQANVDNNAAVIVNTTNPGLDVSLPDPTNLTAGRVVYVTAANGSNDFTLVVNGGGGGNEIAMRANTTATMIWNGSDWTAAGASSSTTLQAAYTNTLTSAGGAEIVLNGPGGNADGLTIRNNPDNPIVGGILEVQSSIGTNLFSVNNLGTELAANGGAETSSSFSTNWSAAPAGGTVTRTTTNGQYVTGQAGVQVVTGSGANRGVRNNLSGNPATNTTYQVSFTGKLSSGTFTTLQVVYSRNGGTNTVACTNYSTQTLITTGWTKVTCTITTDGTAATNPDLIIRQTDSTSRTFWIDNLSFQRNDATTEPSHVQIGGGLNGGPITLFTLDRSSAPPVEDGNEAYLGSMYYDTTSGRIQCYEADGWGACGSAPNNFVNLTPEYAGAVLNGTGVGTLTADFCANEASVLEVNTTICDGTGNPGVVAGNYYRWTSPQATQQTYSIYVTYQLPAEFGQFSDNDTVKLTARTDHVSNGIVTYEMFRSEGGNLYACGSETTVTTSANTWQTVSINGDEATGCGFSAASADNNVIFKINVKANSNANVYVGNLSFTTLGQ